MTEYVLVVHVFRPIGRVVQTCYVDPMCFEDECFLYSDISPLGISVANDLGHCKEARGTSHTQVSAVMPVLL